MFNLKKQLNESEEWHSKELYMYIDKDKKIS